MSPSEKSIYSFPKFYEIRKNIISLNVAEEKGEILLTKKDLPGN
jgi:hypothetical protein